MLWYHFRAPSPWSTHSQLCVHWLLKTPCWLLLRTALSRRGPTFPRETMLPPSPFLFLSSILCSLSVNVDLVHAFFHSAPFSDLPVTHCLFCKLNLLFIFPWVFSKRFWVLFNSVKAFSSTTLVSTLRDMTLTHSPLYSQDLALFLAGTDAE